jgi:DNA-binding HxlR family transcriptional regulator
LLVIRNVFLGMRRFADLQDNLKITPTTLNRRLRQLCSDGILQRRRYSTKPTRYEYHLTEKGLDLMPVVMTLTVWGKRWLSPADSQALRAVDCATGHELQPTLADAVTGKPIAPGSFRLEAGVGADALLRQLLEGAPVFPVVD